MSWTRKMNELDSSYRWVRLIVRMSFSFDSKSLHCLQLLRHSVFFESVFLSLLFYTFLVSLRRTFGLLFAKGKLHGAKSLLRWLHEISFIYALSKTGACRQANFIYALSFIVLLSFNGKCISLSNHLMHLWAI